MTEDATDGTPAREPRPGVPPWPRGGLVDWRPWGQDAVDDAVAAEVPILLSLTAAWSEECRQMDAETYGDPRVAAAIDDGFLPVRADVDRQPRVASRYAMGGVPSTVFLAPDGSVLTGAGPLGVDAMRDAIDGVRRTWTDRGADAGRVPRALADDPTPSGEVEEGIERQLLGTLRESFDDEAGGWGTGAKFPLPGAVEFALKRDRSMALRTLDAIDAHLLDEDGGVFRSAANADWSGVRREKLLDTNAAVLRTFVAAYRYTGDDAYRRAAERGVRYLLEGLWLDDAAEGSGAFAASETPVESGPPPQSTGATDAVEAGGRIDETIVTDWNALAVDALLAYAGVTDDDRARGHARRALSTIVATLPEPERIVHARDADGPVGERGLLIDHARTIRALVRARGVVGPDPGTDRTGADRSPEASPLALATSLADGAIDALRSSGSFRDGPASGAGLLDRPLRPLDGNVAMADALLDLSIATGDDGYAEVARETAAAFAGAHERFGPQTASFGSVVGRLLRGTLRIEVSAPAGSDLHRAALRIADHEAIVLPEAGTEPADACAADDRMDDAAHVVRDGQRSGPAHSPEELSRLVAEQF